VTATASCLSQSDPLIGRIYELRQSIKQVFDNDRPNSIKSFVLSGGSSLSASSTTNTTHNKKNANRPPTRACLVWNKTKETCTLLLTTTFENRNPISNDDVANSLNLTKEELVKRLFAIHQTPPLIGRPSIRFEVMPSPGDTLDVNKNSYLVLIPVVIPMNAPWSPPTQARFYSVDLLYINQLLDDLKKDMLHQQEITFLNKEIQFYKSKEQSEHEKVALDKEREEIKRNKEEAAKEKDEQDRIIMALGEQKSADGDETQLKNDDISIHSSIPNPLRHLTCLERKEIQDDFSSYDDNESNSDDINQQRINLGKRLVLLALNKMYHAMNGSNDGSTEFSLMMFL
jgi:hypothetical protein